jgi:DNA-binding PucR family transcriptional regulator
MLERSVRTLAERLGCPTRPLFVPCDQSTGWGWLQLGRDTPTVADVRAAVTADGAQVRLALGEQGKDVPGFRRTHMQARQAQAVAVLAGEGAPLVSAFAEVGPIALMCGDLRATRAWVGDTLGALALDDAHHRRLRDTLRVFLSTGGSYTGAATRLALHKNSVQYRVRKAEEERGRPIREDRLDVEIALTACHWLGAAVLRAPS